MSFIALQVVQANSKIPKLEFRESPEQSPETEFDMKLSQLGLRWGRPGSSWNWGVVQN